MRLDYEIPGMGHKLPFYYAVFDCRLFMYTSDEDCVRNRLQLLTIFMKGSGQLWLLDVMCTLSGRLIGKADSTSDFNWSLEFVCVNLRVTEFPYDAFDMMAIVLPIL